MLRVLILFLVMAAAAVVAVWLADNPGEVTIVWLGAETKLSIGVAVAGALLLAVAVSIAWSLLRFVLRAPRLLANGSRARRQEKGFAALSRGLIAVGAGDLTAAERHAQEARRLIGGHPLSLLLNAQTAQLGGDREGARRAFEAMTRLEPATLLGWRGLFVEARRSGDADEARRAADEAVKIAPSAAWANEAALSDRVARREWAAARQALERAERLRVLDKATSRRQRAVLFAAEAIETEAADPARALNLAREACHLAPGLVPAATVAGRLMRDRGELKKAARLIEAAWKETPHPDLADIYIHLRAGDSALDRLQKAQTLAKLRPGDPESRLAVARAAIEARELALARTELDQLLSEQPTVRACLLMADLVELEDASQGPTRYWLSRAARAPRDKAWVGDGVVSDKWLPASPATGRLDAFEWTTPPELTTQQPALEPPADSAPSSPSPPLEEAGAAADESPDAGVETGDQETPQRSAPAPVLTAPPPSETPPAPAARPTPVVFPVARPPDDPGPEAANARRWRVFQS